MFGAATVRRPAEGRSGVRAYDDMFLIEAHLWRYAAYRAYVGLLSEASRYYLGWLWWLLEPLAMTSVFFFVFTYLRAPNAENFQYFLIIGVTTWLWFANAVANCTESLPGAKTIVSTMRLPKLLFPFATVISASLKHAFVFTTILIVMGAVFGTSPAWLYLPVLLFTQLSPHNGMLVVCSVRLLLGTGRAFDSPVRIDADDVLLRYLLRHRQHAAGVSGGPSTKPDGDIDRRLSTSPN